MPCGALGIVVLQKEAPPLDVMFSSPKLPFIYFGGSKDHGFIIFIYLAKALCVVGAQ